MVDLQCYAHAKFNLKLVIFVFDKKNYIEAQTLKLEERESNFFINLPQISMGIALEKTRGPTKNKKTKIRGVFLLLLKVQSFFSSVFYLLGYLLGITKKRLSSPFLTFK